MRNIQKGIVAVVLTLALAIPASAAGRSSRSDSLFASFKRFFVLVMTRVSPPVGSPTADEPEDTEPATTDELTQTQ